MSLKFKKYELFKMFKMCSRIFKDDRNYIGHLFLESQEIKCAHIFPMSTSLRESLMMAKAGEGAKGWISAL